MSRGFLLLAAAALVAGMVAGCGLKGPLSLPEKPGEVIIRGPQDPPPTPSPSPAETTGAKP